MANPNAILAMIGQKAAKAAPMSMAGDDPEVDQVDPADVGVPATPQMSSVMSSLIAPKASPANAFQAAVMGATPPAAAPGKPSSKNTKTTTSGTKQDLYKSGDELNSQLEMLRSQPEYQDQKASIDRLQDLMGMTAQVHPKGNSWIQPLLALSDAQNGGHMAQSYQPGVSQKSINDDLLKYQDEIAKRKQDLNKSLMGGLKDLKSGQQTDNSQNAFMNGMNLGAMGGGLADVRRNNLIANSGAAFDNDKIAVKMIQSNNGLDRALNMIDGKVPINTSLFNVLQQDMINSMAPGGAATEGKVHREMVETALGALNTLNTKYRGKIDDLRKSQPEVFQQLKDAMTAIKGDYNSAIMDRMNSVASRYKHISDPDVQATVADKVKEYGDRYPLAAKAGAGGPAVDADLSKMSKDELKKYIATHGG